MERRLQMSGEMISKFALYMLVHSVANVLVYMIVAFVVMDLGWFMEMLRGDDGLMIFCRALWLFFEIGFSVWLTVFIMDL